MMSYSKETTASSNGDEGGNEPLGTWVVPVARICGSARSFGWTKSDRDDIMKQFARMIGYLMCTE